LLFRASNEGIAAVVEHHFTDISQRKGMYILEGQPRLDKLEAQYYKIHCQLDQIKVQLGKIETKLDRLNK
jgi:hypothetical protein